MRIYPTVVLEGTALAEHCRPGVYPLLSEEAVLDFCADALCRCDAEGVRVIRMGLHDTPTIRARMVASYYHPAYRELVESRLYLRTLLAAAQEDNAREWEVLTAKGTLSKLLRHRGGNRAHLQEKGITLRAKESEIFAPGFLQINGTVRTIYTPIRQS